MKHRHNDFRGILGKPVDSDQARELIAAGLCAERDGLLVPIIAGGDPAADSPFPALPEGAVEVEAEGENAPSIDFSNVDDDALAAYVDETAQAVAEVAAAPAEFVTEARTAADLLSEMEGSVEALELARAEVAARAETPDEPDTPDTPDPEPVPDDELAARAAELASRAEADEPDDEPEPETPEPEATVETVTAAAAPAVRPRLPRPSRSRRPDPVEAAVSLTAGAGVTDMPQGAEFLNEIEVAEAMIRRNRNMGIVAEGTFGKETIARADWSHLYPEERKLGKDENANAALIASVLSPESIKRELQARIRAQDKGESLVASGGLCAPVTPYYNLQMISQADRPVRAGLPSFNADRGGIRAAAPAALSAITTGVGTVSAADDAAGGTFATKTCQVVDCPPFSEVDVDIIFHCLQFGNLGARTFPERVAQWNQLTLAAHARLAERALLTGIDTASTQVTAQSLGLGATGALLGQILAAANGMRSRNRMSSDAVLRLMLPFWAIDLMISDVIRSQFQRFDSDAARLTALLRRFNVEPSFYIDSATGRGQEFGAQTDGALLPFPDEVVWYLFPEGSFLYLDGGTLELGLVRDSVLNSTNDFQIFGETFENVAFVGVESLAVASTVCDSGAVSGTHAVDCPIDYTHSS